jgi:hypothetical protein
MYSRCRTTFFTTILTLSLVVSSLAQDSQPKQNAKEAPVPAVVAFTLFFNMVSQNPELATKACLNPSDALGLIVDAAKFNRSLFALLRARRAVTPAEQSVLVRAALADLRHDLTDVGFQQFQVFFQTQKLKMHRTVQLPASGQRIRTL